MIAATGLDRDFGSGARGVRALLSTLGCIQIDPIDRVGTNAELVAGARVTDLRAGDVHRHLLGHSFEHFAKERCILDARFFPHYRGRAVETPWWRNSERMLKLSQALLDDVLAELAERGPATPQALTDRGRTDAMDWAGWKGTTSLTSLALEVLWTRCDVVCSGRDGRGRRLYDIPARALPGWVNAPRIGDFGEEMLLARVACAGLLSRAGGPQWSMLKETRSDGTIPRLLESGTLVEVAVAGRPYLSLPNIRTARAHGPRVLGPLDPLIWDRTLVRDAFGFDYIWEIYKPAAVRQWGYYVCPVIDGDSLVGRVEGHRADGRLVIDATWGDVPTPALKRLSTQNGCTLDASIAIRKNAK